MTWLSHCAFGIFASKSLLVKLSRGQQKESGRKVEGVKLKVVHVIRLNNFSRQKIWNSFTRVLPLLSVPFFHLLFNTKTQFWDNPMLLENRYITHGLILNVLHKSNVPYISLSFDDVINTRRLLWKLLYLSVGVQPIIYKHWANQSDTECVTDLD